MLWRKYIEVPFGHEAVVDNQIVTDRKRLSVGRHDQVYFVSFSPLFVTLTCEANCKEGIRHKATVVLKTQLDRNNLAEVLRDAGCSTRGSVHQVNVEQLVKSQNLAESVQASIQTYVHNARFYDLANQDVVRQALHQCISTECRNARLLGEVVSCKVECFIPKPEVMAQLAALAGVTEVIVNNARQRNYADANLGRIVEYFLEAIRQAELIQVETERAKAEAERARVDSQRQMAIARAEVKIAEIEQQNHIAARQAELDEEEARRQQAAQERNARIKDSGAQYEFAYKSQRLDEDMALTQKANEVAKFRGDEEAAIRERKRLDMQLDLERERTMAEIRAEEKSRLIGELRNVVGKLAEMPAPDYSHLSTLICSGNGAAGEAASGAGSLMLGLLAKFTDGLVSLPESPRDSTVR